MFKVEPIIHVDMWDDEYIINIGRSDYPKGYCHLMRTFKNTALKHNIKLVICMEVALKPYLLRLNEALGFESDVILLGWFNNPFYILAKGMLFVFSSLYGSSGNALLDVVVIIHPVISPDCKYGPEEIIRDGEYGI